MFNKSITKKFMFLYVVVGLTSLSLLGFYSYFKAKQALVERATEQLNSVKSLKKIQIENYLNQCVKEHIEPNSLEINAIMLDTNQTNGLGKTGEVYLVGDDFFLKSKSRFFLNSTKPIKSETRSVKQAFNQGNGNAVFLDYRNILCLSSFCKLNVEGLNWIIIAEIDYNEAMVPISNLRNDLLFLSIIVLILILSIAQVITTDIIVPIVKFKNSAIKIGQGDFDAKVDIKSENEFGVLASTFNQMIEDIQKNTSELLNEKTKRISALYDGQEFERHRISRDLHDGLAQQLIAIKMALENLISRKELANENKLFEFKNLVNSSIDEVRKISYDLAPAGILEFSLEVALENLCGQVQNTSELDIEFSAYGNFSYLDERTKIYLYRIIQEALNNAIKHAEATQIQIQLTETNSNLVLMIEDNGKGFNYDRNNLGLGKGLLNMRERSILLNGTFDVETFPEKGTTIRVKVNKLQEYEKD
jgi:signal transduction histidine kinase